MTTLNRPTGRRTTGNAEVDRQLQAVLDELGVRENRDLLFEILADGVRIAGPEPSRLDLKITAAALREMRDAFSVFAPYRGIPKVTIFGSARTKPADPLYRHTRDVARELAERGWMVVTGAGPGIMAAGMEGAGRDRSLGVSIRLPFEERANDIIQGDAKLVSMKYFFTRKLMLLKESSGFIALPGGFGTLDETFELLTLHQTGKAVPAPVVLLDTPGGTYWHGFQRFVDEHLASAGLISVGDTALYKITDDVSEARREVLGFYRNYDSIRWVGDLLVMRLRAEPTDADLALLNDRFGHLCPTGSIQRTGPLPAEVSGRDALDLPRIVLPFDIFKVADIRALIDGVNMLPSAPPLPD
jgi:uncharacterized protein (TIGR00730 family)